MRNLSVIKGMYQGNGVTRRFAIPFEYNDTAQIFVTVTTYDDGDYTYRVLDRTEFTIDEDSVEIVYPKSADDTPISNSQYLTVWRDTDLLQLIDLTNQGAAWPDSIEGSLDKLHQIVQELAEGLSRALKVDIGDPQTPDEKLIAIQDYVLAAAESSRSASASEASAQRAAEAAATSEANAAESERLAGGYADTATAAASRAEDSAISARAYNAPDYDNAKTYQAGEVVTYTDGNSYKALQETTGNEPPNIIYWQKVTDYVGDNFFEIDEYGYIVPMDSPSHSRYWRVDQNGYIVPIEGGDGGYRPDTRSLSAEYLNVTNEGYVKHLRADDVNAQEVDADEMTAEVAAFNTLTANAVNAGTVILGDKDLGEYIGHISKDIYYAADYGILPDGSDISANLNRLISLVNANGGGIIQFNDGTYVVDSYLDDGAPRNSIIFLSNVYFVGTGSTTITSGGNEFYSLFRELGYGHETDNVRFYGITFDCYLDSPPSTAGNKYRCAILAQRVSNMVVENCRFIFNSINAVDFSTGDSIQDIIDHKNSGDYYVHDIIFRNNRFIFKIASNLAYYDNNAISLCGKNIYILGNRFDVDILTDSYNVVPNAAVRMDGENIVVSGNIINGWANAADMDIVDDRGDVRRNYIFENNICNTYRGIWLWARPGKILRGAYIRNNIFTQAFSSYAHVAGGAGAGTSAVGLASHNTDSYNGYYKDIQITGNVVDYTSAISFMSGLSQATYEATSYYINVGTPFEAAFAAFNLAGSSNGRQEVIVKQNTIKNSVFPAVYVGGKSTSLGYEIDGNVFIDCDYGSNHSIIALRDYVVGVSVKNNNIIDTGNPSHGNTFIACGAGQYRNASQARIFELMAKNNNVLTINPASVFDNNYTAVMWSTCDVDDVHITGTGAAPTWIPYKIGQTIFDKASGKLYFATGTTAVSDWKEIALN